MRHVLANPVSRDLVAVAFAFVELQDARLAADYDLENDPAVPFANTCLTLCQIAFERWPAIQADPNTHAFLVSLILADRSNRRG